MTFTGPARVQLFKLLNLSTNKKCSRLYSNLCVKNIGTITCIGLNRTTKKNSLNVDLVKELKEAVESYEEDKDSLVAVLYGERGIFSYGYDADDFRENPKLIEEIEEIGILHKYPLKPIVAAVSGHAAGPGFDLALWCDFRIVEDTAVMGGYARRFGMPASDIVIHRMYSLLGLNKAMDLMMTGRFMNSKEALECGVATRVVACGTGLGQAVNLANSLANMPQACLRSDRAALISLSDKFPLEVKSLIENEKSKQRLLAREEAKKGLHITASGDVRQKVS